VNYDVFEKNSYWFRECVVEATFDYRASGGEAVALPPLATTQVIRHHYLERDAVFALLERAGFAEVDLLNDRPNWKLAESGQLFFRCSKS
jgi:hypothetical protein